MAKLEEKKKKATKRILQYTFIYLSYYNTQYTQHTQHQETHSNAPSTMTAFKNLSSSNKRPKKEEEEKNSKS